MDDVGQETTACSARRQVASSEGWTRTNDWPESRLPKTSGASSRQVSHSMQLSSTKRSPGTFSATASSRRAMDDVVTAGDCRRDRRWRPGKQWCTPGRDEPGKEAA